MHQQAHTAIVLVGPGLQNPAYQDDMIDVMVPWKLLGESMMNPECLNSGLFYSCQIMTFGGNSE